MTGGFGARSKAKELRAGGSRSEHDGQLRRLTATQDVELDACAGGQLAGDHVERMRLIERGAVDGRDDIASLQPALDSRYRYPRFPWWDFSSGNFNNYSQVFFSVSGNL